MAGKGGGAWKVAYADFVTAMMAFFLVMWITAQDPKVKEEIENYFAAPLGYTPFGEPTHASTGGAVESLSSGNIPSNEAVEMGRGRAHHADIRSDQRATEIVIDWLHMQPAVLTYWKGHAQRILDRTEERHSAEGAPSLHESAAVVQLARLLRAELHQQVPVEDQGIYRDLLQEALADVDWKSVASAILRDCPIVSAPREKLGHGNRATSVERGESEFSQG